MVSIPLQSLTIQEQSQRNKYDDHIDTVEGWTVNSTSVHREHEQAQHPHHHIRHIVELGVHTVSAYLRKAKCEDITIVMAMLH